MNYIKGKIRNIIFQSNTGYKVGIIRIKESNDEEMLDFVNKTITFTGYFADINTDDSYILYGNLIYNDKYGYQYNVSSYERQEIVGKDAVLEFLASPLVKGCGQKTAEDIVNALGEDAIKKIKENFTNLLLVPKMTERKALKIYDSIIKYQSTDEMIVKLKEYGFSINEALTIINKYGNKTLSIVEANPYSLIEIIDFNKLDKIYLNLENYNNEIRLKACFIENIKRLEMEQGDTYFYLDELKEGLKRNFNIIENDDTIDTIIEELILKNEIVRVNNQYYSSQTFYMEDNIANNLMKINDLPPFNISKLDTQIKKLEEKNKVIYNEEQKNAIKKSLENRVTIITGGPGTGKTTIIKAITQLYIQINNITNKEISNEIALLAPTGRAAKKLAESTNLTASTIHRFLKWNKEDNEFQINELNKNYHRLIIVDETSMIDTALFDALLKGICTNIRLILVGDSFQLPSVGPGLILNDLISSGLFTFCPLETIYRQSNNSYIPYLAKEIKNKDISQNFTNKRDDYNFLEVSSSNIKETIKKICEISISKGLTDKDMQILIPMYKGENGIDNINIVLRDIFNPMEENKKEIKFGEITYRIGDKVLQLVNDTEHDVYNGDIGYIKNIVSNKINKKGEVVLISFLDKVIEYKKEDLIKIKHAYAMTIHKSQGSEFPHIIMPITKNYYKMLYNKLIYTGVSRAKKSLMIIGEIPAFLMAVNNDYSSTRKTTLTKRLNDKITI